MFNINKLLIKNDSILNLKKVYMISRTSKSEKKKPNENNKQINEIKNYKKLSFEKKTEKSHAKSWVDNKWLWKRCQKESSYGKFIYTKVSASSKNKPKTQAANGCGIMETSNAENSRCTAAICQ